MSKLSVKKMTIALEQAGVLRAEDGENWEITGGVYSTKDAYGIMYGNEPQAEKQRKPAERTPHAVEETALGIAQYMSSSFKVMARWGDAEVSVKSLIAATQQAFSGDEFISVSEKMVRNTVNKWKRNGIVEQTKKGYFRSSETSKFDWTQFKR